MEEIYSEIMNEAKEGVKAFRQEIRKSKHGLLKLAGIELIPVAMGASLGSLGRITGANWIPAIPLVMDAIGGGYRSARSFWGLAKYGVGVALPYADKIYPIFQENMPSILQTVESLMDKF